MEISEILIVMLLNFDLINLLNADPSIHEIDECSRSQSCHFEYSHLVFKPLNVNIPVIGRERQSDVLINLSLRPAHRHYSGTKNIG